MKIHYGNLNDGSGAGSCLGAGYGYGAGASGAVRRACILTVIKQKAANAREAMGK